MKIDKLSIIGFKNLLDTELKFPLRLNAFVGDNGAGKTNIIDAIHYLGIGRALSASDSQSVAHGKDFFIIEGSLTTDSQRLENVVCSYNQGKKRVKRAGKEYEKLSDHIGLVPVVVVSPSDSHLISDAAEERRRWLNSFISQINRNYLTSTIKYNNLVAERNKLLKNYSANMESVLDILDMQLVATSESIHPLRKEMIERITPKVEQFYKTLSDDTERVSIEYKSELNHTPFESILCENRSRDIVNTHTGKGLHRDDIVLEIGGYPLRKYGSQGQQKSLLIALKLAQYIVLSEELGEKPLLLLDDLFDKLDANRVERLIKLLRQEDFGQIFISDCNKLHLEQILSRCGEDFSIITVHQGEITQ